MFFFWGGSAPEPRLHGQAGLEAVRGWRAGAISARPAVDVRPVGGNDADDAHASGRGHHQGAVAHESRWNPPERAQPPGATAFQLLALGFISSSFRARSGKPSSGPGRGQAGPTTRRALAQAGLRPSASGRSVAEVRAAGSSWPRQASGRLQRLRPGLGRPAAGVLRHGDQDTISSQGNPVGDPTQE